MIDSKGNITVIEPFLYNGKSTVNLVHINEWIYGLLNFTSDTEYIQEQNVIHTRVRKKNSRPSKTKKKKRIVKKSNN